MKREVETTINDNGSYTRKETITQTPADGWVSDTVMRPHARHNQGKVRKGYGKTVAYTTNDPRAARPFVYGMCGLCFMIGIALLCFHIWNIGIFFIVIPLIAFFGSKKRIDAVDEELKEKGQAAADLEER